MVTVNKAGYSDKDINDGLRDSNASNESIQGNEPEDETDEDETDEDETDEDETIDESPLEEEIRTRIDTDFPLSGGETEEDFERVVKAD